MQITCVLRQEEYKIIVILAKDTIDKIQHLRYEILLKNERDKNN